MRTEGTGTARTHNTIAVGSRRGGTYPGEAAAGVADVDDVAAPVEAVDELDAAQVAQAAAHLVAEQLRVQRALRGAHRAARRQPLPRARAHRLQRRVARAVRRQVQRHVVPRHAVVCTHTHTLQLPSTNITT